MFFVVNKEKIYSYIVTLSVIGVLFTISAVLPTKTVETSSTVVKNAESNLINNNSIIN